MEKKCACCEKTFKVNKKTLICLRCSKCYCSDDICWVECNDEYTGWAHDGSKRGIYGEIYISACDLCYLEKDEY